MFTLQKTDILHTEVGVGRNFVNFWPKFFEKKVAEEAVFFDFFGTIWTVLQSEEV